MHIEKGPEETEKEIQAIYDQRQKTVAILGSLIRLRDEFTDQLGKPEDSPEHDKLSDAIDGVDKSINEKKRKIRLLKVPAGRERLDQDAKILLEIMENTDYDQDDLLPIIESSPALQAKIIAWVKDKDPSFDGDQDNVNNRALGVLTGNELEARLKKEI